MTWRRRCVEPSRGELLVEPPGRGGTDAEDATEAQREIQSAIERSGVEAVILCATDEVSPAALRAVAASIRSLEGQTRESLHDDVT